MKMKSLILIFIALGCGLVDTIGISQVMERNSGGGGTTMKMEQILVAKGDIDIGAMSYEGGEGFSFAVELSLSGNK